MASDYLLEIDGVQGESRDSKHPNAIEIDSWSIGGTHPGSGFVGTGISSGKVQMNDFHVSKVVDKSIGQVFIGLATGKHFNKATLYCRKATGDGGQQEYLTVTLKDVMITNWQLAGANGGPRLPSESVSLDFAEIQFEYKPQKDDGSLGPSSPVKYNVKEHRSG